MTAAITTIITAGVTDTIIITTIITIMTITMDIETTAGLVVMTTTAMGLEVMVAMTTIDVADAMTTTISLITEMIRLVMTPRRMSR